MLLCNLYLPAVFSLLWPTPRAVSRSTLSLGTLYTGINRASITICTFYTVTIAPACYLSISLSRFYHPESRTMADWNKKEDWVKLRLTEVLPLTPID